MKTLILLIISCMFVFTAHAEDTTKQVAAIHDTLKVFHMELKTALKQAMKKGGPEYAIKICEEKAPNIAAELSKKKDWHISRTSLKTRNPVNAPDKWELAVLRQFEKRKASGEDIKNIEFGEIVSLNGDQQFRFMKAIPTNKICLTCHGEKISSGISAVLDDLYPEDKARGFREGDIRGAFSIIQPIIPSQSK